MELSEHNRIFIRNLCVKMSAGIYDFEKTEKQRVLFSACLDVEPNLTPSDISDLVSYEDVCNDIRDIAQSKHHDLLECLANEIIEGIFNTYKGVRKIDLTIEKPDIIEDAQSVGISVAKKRPY